MSWTGGLDEAGLRRRIPVFINSYNQLTYLRDTVDWFARHGFANVTVHDNRSDYPPLLAYFGTPEFTAKARLVRLAGNIGPRRSLAVAAEDPSTAGGFIFTDPDLRLPEPPAPDLLTMMFAAGPRHGVIKIGLALSLDPQIIDLDRVTYHTRTVRQVERKYWTQAVEPDVFKATTDTTFFLYVPQDGDPRRFNDHGLRQARIPSLRIGREGFIAVHRPWLLEDDLAPEERAAYMGRGLFSTLGDAQRTSTEAPAPRGRRGRAPPRAVGHPADPKLFLLNAFADCSAKPITLVQVGAHDGKMADPLFPLIARGGWQGVMVEPHPAYFADLSALHAERPALLLRNVAIAEQPGRMDLFHLNEGARGRYPRGARGCASFDRSRMEDALRRGSRRKGIALRPDDIVATSVEVSRLDSVLTEAGIDRADIVVIDVEGFEAQVLRSFSLKLLAPRIAIVECNGANLGDEAEIAAVLHDCGLHVLRLGDDLVGLRPGTTTVSVEAALDLAGVPRLGG
jgi:FkbM family methyltransferase